jgi:hypothetical protein
LAKQVNIASDVEAKSGVSENTLNFIAKCFNTDEVNFITVDSLIKQRYDKRIKHRLIKIGVMLFHVILATIITSLVVFLITRNSDFTLNVCAPISAIVFLILFFDKEHFEKLGEYISERNKYL